MRKLFFALLFFMVLGSSSAQHDLDTIVSMRYSNQFMPGDSFTWEMPRGAENFDLPEGYVGNITLTVKKTPSSYITEEIDFEAFFSEHFAFNVAGYDMSGLEDLTFLFLLFNEVTFEDGTTMNFCDEFWVYMVIDDFYYDYGKPIIDISREGSYVTYNASLEYDDGSLAKFTGIINRDLGITDYLYASYTDVNNKVDEIQVRLIGSELTRSEEEIILKLPFNFNILYIFVLVLIVRKKIELLH
ncbi:MAG: hypothetical protein INQ03_17910 [Candidatus Heimdallarchaeota archaeon]|nr:hypothetical protein [Candidatus Heimdallarchaeota archaeon]